MQRASDPNELKQVLTHTDCSFRFDCGFSRLITIENKNEFFSVAWKHFVIYSIFAELSQFRDGFLNTLNLKHLATASPAVLHYLLTAENAKPLTAETLQDMFVTQFSEVGSNHRKTEETIIHNWFTFVDEVAGNSKQGIIVM